jgi:RNA polymerase sigma-54 factor
MAMEMRQELKLSQQLVMTPQLQQAIRLLQLSRMELADLVHDEMLENPILDDEMDLENELPRITAPTLIVHSRESNPMTAMIRPPYRAYIRRR